jgi:transposase-like protein
MPFKPGHPFHKKGKGKNYKKKFQYTYADISRLLGIAEGTLRQWKMRGKFDPTSLEDVVRLYEEIRLARPD